ncbi:sodium-dependent transporter [bacterium]|nr:sodium-dependent transporter [bacterium]
MESGGSGRGLWSSKLGFILAGAGSAIGLGNIWRFPATAGANGGAAFIFIYLASIVLICFAIMIAELTLGRHTQKNPVGMYNALAPGSSWKYLGMLGVVTGWGISSFYSVIAGLTLGYVFKTAFGAFSQINEAGETLQIFIDFVSDPMKSVGLHGVFMILTMLVLFGGVKGGIERWSKILMPVLLAILIFLVFRSVTFEGADRGVAFLLQPKWGELTGRGVLAAVGQAFFSLSLGMGTMITYGSYLSKKENIVSSGAWVCSLDTMIALLAGFAIFPALFAFGMDDQIQAGAGLIFIVLPNIFNKIFLGTIFGTGFFILLSIAALTSLISIVEVPAAYFIDELKWSRKKAVWVAGIGAFVAGVPAALGLGAVSSLGRVLSIEGRNYDFLDLMNLMFGQYSLIIGSLGVAVFVGWKWGTAKANMEISAGYEAFKNGQIFAFFVRFIAPIAITGLLLYLLFNPNAFA